MKVKIGTYTGSGSPMSITGVGFLPDFVLVESITASRPSHIRITGMGTNESFRPRGDASVVTNAIVSLDADGFTVNNGSGSGANLVNVNAVTHYYFAVKAVAGFSSIF